MENSILFNHILRGLGFEVYTAGVRIRIREGGVPKGDYIGWVHIVNIVTLPNNQKYMLDVGFGGDGPTKPIPLISGQVVQNIGTQELRLVHGNIPQQNEKKQKLWTYQYRNSPNAEWNSFYSFPELEFLHQDFEIMNYFTSTSPESFQTYTILVVKFLRRKKVGEVGGEDGKEGKEGGVGIYGKVMMVNGEVKQNLGGKTKVVKVCRTEGERIEALREWFGIELTEEEKKGIRGLRSELVG